MAVTTKCTVKVETGSFRAALAAVAPHAKRTKKDDDLAMHRIRLVLANGVMFVTATNGKTSGLSRLSYVEDSRGTLWEPDDGPFVIDLSPAHVKLIRQWLAAKAVGDDVDMLVAITPDLKEDEVEFEAIGTQNEGERYTIVYPEAHELMPDVVAITGQALAGAGPSNDRVLVQDAKLIGLFEEAGTQYGAPIRIRPTGDTDTAGFVVECGAAFTGTIASDTGGDEGRRRNAEYTQGMLEVLKPLRLVTA